ncbi:MAG: glycosyl hydrolase family 28-related protein, partial [Syntrophobacteraceae bacterium]
MTQEASSRSLFSHFAWMAIAGVIAAHILQLSPPYAFGQKRFPPSASHSRPPDPHLSVTDFGAAPNDGRDDTAAIQAAVDAARKGNVKSVVFPPGEYTISSVNIGAGLTLWGYGATMKLLPMQGAWVRMFTTDKKGYTYAGLADSPPLVIKGFTFDGNRLNQGPYKNYELAHQAQIFLQADPTTSGRLVARLQDITFQEGAADGIDIYKNVNVDMRNITAINLFREGIGIGGGSDIVNIDTFTSSGNDEYTGFHVEMSPGAGPNVISVSNFRLQKNFSPGLINGSTLTATNIVSGSPWSVSAGDSSTMIISNSSLGGGGAGGEGTTVIFPANVEFDNVDFYVNDLQAAPADGISTAIRVMTNNSYTSYGKQRL